MKTSVYIPDELWHKVLEAQPDASASQLLQDCIKTRFESKVPPAYAVVTDEQEAQLERLVERLPYRLKEVYHDGYNLGLAAMGDLPTFELMWLLASLGFDLGAFERETKASEYETDSGPARDVFSFSDWWREIRVLYGTPEYFEDFRGLPIAAERGVKDAMRAFWASVSGEAPAPHPRHRGAGIEPVKEASDAPAE